MSYEQHFWMVWNDTAFAPTVRHPNLDSAEREAARLALKHPGATFYVLRAIKKCSHSTVSWEMLNDLPF